MPDLPDLLADWWPWVAALLDVALAAVVSGHIVLTKRDVRAAIGWTALVWLAPVVGAALYGAFGINRIRRRAGRLRGRPFDEERGAPDPDRLPAPPPVPAPVPDRWAPLARLVGRATGLPLLDGNAVEPLVDGDAAYPAMVAAIERAERTVALVSYIFETDRAGMPLILALERAARRGVEVRVLVDGAGARYSRPTAIAVLRRRGVRVAPFLPRLLPVTNPYWQLRNHRKLLVCDGCEAFTGGMNIREHCVLALAPAAPTRDVHFRVAGPVVRELLAVFAFDWQFTTGEALDGPDWWPAPAAAGPVLARAIADGPDEDFETLHTTLLGALAQARERVRIVNPYFLPDWRLQEALRVAALRGAEVDVILPSRGNLRLVEWAMWGQLPQVLDGEVRVWLSPPPFDHAKLLTVDGTWTLLGSANLDPRALRLNFELGLECYDPTLVAAIDALIDARQAAARPLTRRDVTGRPLPARLRDGAARLLSPYL